jgi:cell division inhibitor SepF
MKLVVYIPASPEDARKAADAVKIGTGVVLNGEYLEETARRRVIDFLDGAVYVIGGESQRISDTVQLYTPAGVDVSNESILRYGGRPIGDGKR